MKKKTLFMDTACEGDRFTNNKLADECNPLLTCGIKCHQEI